MKIKEIPLENRPRERFLKQGPEALSDAELFAILLRTGTRGKNGKEGENVTDMSNRLIKKYGLENLFQCSLKELQKIKGIGPYKAMQILVMCELNKRVNSGKIIDKKIDSAEDVFNYYKEKLKDKKKEHFYALLLDSKNKIIKEELISVGTLNASLVHPREVFKSAIKESANAIILVHNHPSGDCEASDEDEMITEVMIKAGGITNIKVLDHVIVGKDKWKGLIKSHFSK